MNTAFRHGIDVRRSYQLVSRLAKIAVALVVRHDEDDVWLLRFGEGRKAGEAQSNAIRVEKRWTRGMVARLGSGLCQGKYRDGVARAACVRRAT